MTNMSFNLTVRSNNTIAISAKILRLCEFTKTQHFILARSHVDKYEEDHIYYYINDEYEKKRLAANKSISITMKKGMPSPGNQVKLTVLKEEKAILIEPSISSLIAKN